MKAVPASAPKVRSLRIWSAVHTWTSLISMVFMLILCLTGLPLIFMHEIDDLLGNTVDPPETIGAIEAVPASRIIETAKTERPGQAVQYLIFDDHEPNVVWVGLAKTVESPEPEGYLSFDKRTGQVLQARKPGEGFMGFVYQLHVDMFLGLPGKLFLGLMGLLFVAAIVSGIVLYGPFMRKLEFGTVRRARTKRIKWLDWHNLLGVSTIVWALVVGSTGTINTWADLMLKLWQFGQLSEMTAPYRDKPAPTQLVAVDMALVAAKEAAPDMQPRFVAYPGTMLTSRNHYAVFMHGDTPLTSRILKPGLVDAETGRLTDMREMPWYIQGLFLSQPLHFGDYGGMPLKILWALFTFATMVVLGSGIYLWVVRQWSARPVRTAAVRSLHSASVEPAE